MSLQQTPPGRGGQSRRVHFCYTPTSAGPKGNWHAYIAGPCQWYICHTKGKTKPCLHDVTGGELSCPVCTALNVPEEVGYQPLYRQNDGKPVMVIVHEYSREQIDPLTFHQRVLVGRGESITDAVFILPALSKEPRYCSRLPERNREADLTDTLLRLWRIPELTAWHEGHTKKSDNALSVPAVAQPPRAKPTGPPSPARDPIAELKAAEAKAKAEEALEEQKIASTMSTLLAGVPKTNGAFKRR